MNKKEKLKDLQEKIVTRVKMPKGEEKIGIVDKRLGGSRMHIRTVDGKISLARVPGRLKKYLWIREGDIVIIKPWELTKEKSDLIYKYKRNEVKFLEKKGLLENLEELEEF